MSYTTLYTPRDGHTTTNSNEHRSRSTPSNRNRGGAVIAHLIALEPILGEDVLDPLLTNDTVRQRLSSLTKSDGLDAVDSFKKSLQIRSSDLDPIADPANYFLKIINRYQSTRHPTPVKDGKVMWSLRQLRSIEDCQESVDVILAQENISVFRPILSSLTRTDGLEAVQKLGSSLKDRASHDLEPVANPVGYFHKILSRYTSNNNKKRRLNSAEAERNVSEDDDDLSMDYDHGRDDDDDDDDEEDDDNNTQRKLRTMARQLGRFKSNYSKSEQNVAKLKAEVKNLTSSLEETKAELNEAKYRLVKLGN